MLAKNVTATNCQNLIEGKGLKFNASFLRVNCPGLVGRIHTI